MSRPAGRTAINSSASHVFQVLRMVSESGEPLGVAEIGRRLGLPASTVYRALITLEESEYISRHQNSPRYELGPMPRLLSRALFRRFALQRASAASLRKLARETGETVSISARMGWYSLRLAVVYGSRDFYHRDRLGEVMLLHEEPSSKAILAFLPDEEIEAYWRFVRRRHPEAWSEALETAVTAEVAATRAAGFLAQPLAVSPEYAAVALPVRNPQGHAIASILINGPVLRAGAEAPPPAWIAIRDELEADVKAAPERFQSPFVHVPADEMFIRLPPAYSHAG